MRTVSSPSTQISPASGRSRPMMFLRSTDLPVPDGPMMALILPLGTSKVMSWSTVWEPNRFVTPRSEMIASRWTPLVVRGVQRRGRRATTSPCSLAAPACDRPALHQSRDYGNRQAATRSGVRAPGSAQPTPGAGACAGRGLVNAIRIAISCTRGPGTVHPSGSPEPATTRRGQSRPGRRPQAQSNRSRPEGAGPGLAVAVPLTLVSRTAASTSGSGSRTGSSRASHRSR